MTVLSTSVSSREGVKTTKGKDDLVTTKSYKVWTQGRLTRSESLSRPGSPFVVGSSDRLDLFRIGLRDRPPNVHQGGSPVRRM